MTIYYDGQYKLTPEQKDWIERALETVLRVEGLDQAGEVSISFMDYEAIRQLNLEYRQLDATTDVLSFPQLESLAEAKTLDYLFLGDIVINLDQVARQAGEYGHSQARELSYLTVHSLYHLLGFDHLADDDKQQMRQKEKVIMELLEEI